MSPLVPLTSTPGRKSDVHSKSELNKSTTQINKTPGRNNGIIYHSELPESFVYILIFFFLGVTPFVFSGDNSVLVTPGTTKKNTFDLKASLSRPLTYKPHKGTSAFLTKYE